MAESDFSSLLHEAEQLVGGTGESRELPRVERSLGQVLEASQELYSRLAQDGSQDVQAHLLLGSKGVDLPEITQRLHSLSARRTLEPLDPVADTDIQSFLRNEKENAILAVIEEVHKESFKACMEQRWDHVQSEWKAEKTRLMGALIGPSQNWLDINKSQSSNQTIVPEVVPNPQARSNLNSFEMAYAKEISDYNKLVVQGNMRPNLVQKFALIAEGFKDTRVNNIWEIVKYISNIPPLPKGEDPIKSRIEHENTIVQQAKSYLENRYLGYMNSCVNQNLAIAKRGGVPGTYSLVKAFVGIRIPPGTVGLQDGEVDERPLWAMVYYCLRSGDSQAALECIQKAGPGHEEFTQVLEKRAKKSDHQLISSKLESALRLQYRRHIRNATDPYKRAVYCVVAGCDVVEEHPQVSRTADDYLWLKLSFINQGDGQGGCLTYADLQKTILEDFGESYYNAAEHPHIYSSVLLLSGQLEAAIEFMNRSERLRVHAVHMALALSELYMLGSPRNVQAPLLSVDIEDPVPCRRLNLARLIMLYVKKFEMTDPVEAIQYLYFLRNLKDPDGRNLFMVCVSDLTLECRDYDLIFGKVQPNGYKTRGILDQFSNMQIESKTIAGMVADELVKKGLFEDAIRMYDVAENYNKVLNLFCTMLSQVVHQQSRPDSLRARLHDSASEFASRLTSVGTCNADSLASFETLRQLLTFFDQYHTGQYVKALETLRETQLVPLDISQVEERVAGFRRLSSEVCRVIPDLLLAAMEIVYSQFIALKRDEATARFLDKAQRDKQLDYYREQGKSLTNFAGTVPYRMPGDTNQRLVQMEILMH